jgi:hypothetical protein
MDLLFKYLGCHLDFGVRFGGTFLYLPETQGFLNYLMVTRLWSTQKLPKNIKIVETDMTYNTYRSQGPYLRSPHNFATTQIFCQAAIEQKGFRPNRFAWLQSSKGFVNFFCVRHKPNNQTLKSVAVMKAVVRCFMNKPRTVFETVMPQLQWG